MISQYLLINCYSVLKGQEQNIQEFVTKNETITLNKNSFYSSLDGDELIEFISLNSLNELTDYENRFALAFSNYACYLRGDIKRELLRYVESPIKARTAIPQTNYVQLRHIEVLPSAYQAYLKWRNETIFEVIRNNSNTIDSFDAYHSLISQVPGVMFISCFNGSIEEYMEPFTNDHYKNIITQAGDSYITGGNEGLYTKVYKKLGM